MLRVARSWFAFVVTIVFLAGCLGGTDEGTQTSGGPVRGGPSKAISPGTLPGTQFGDRVQVYGKDGLLPTELPVYPGPIIVSSSQFIKPAGASNAPGCGEPTGGVTWKNDWIWQVCLQNVFVSKDHGQTWSLASTQLSSPTTLDPYMWVDTATDRVFSVQLYVGCSYLAFSDDYGATWVSNPAACGIPVNDHQTMAGGPPAPPLVSNPVYRNHLYYCVNQLADTMCARSYDGGLSWAGTVAQVTTYDVESGRQCSAINGHVVVGKDGTAYLPKRTCNRPSVMTSTDNGVTWSERIVSRAHPVVQSLAHDPTIATDTEANAYYFWTGDDGILRLSYSKNKGQAWSAPVRVSPLGMTMSLFETSVAGDPGRVAVAYFGTSQPRQSSDPKLKWTYASEAPNETVWHLYLTMSENALDENPIFTTIQMNPAEDPIQRGCIWLQGGNGGPNRCRNLLDFFDATIGKDGRVYVHYDDGCVDTCITWTPESKDPIRRTSWGVVGMVQAGPSLFAEQDWVLPFDTPAPAAP